MEKNGLVQTLQCQIEEHLVKIQELRSQLHSSSESPSLLENEASKKNNKDAVDESFTNEIQSLQRSLSMMSEQLKTSKARSKETIQQLQSNLQDVQHEHSVCQKELLNSQLTTRNLQRQLAENNKERKESCLK